MATYLFLRENGCLNAIERQAYDLLRAGFQQQASCIDIPPLTPQGLEKIVTYVSLDDPMLYVDNWQYRSGATISVAPQYSYPQAQLRMFKQEMDRTLAPLFSELSRISGSYNKELRVHDYLIDRVTYSLHAELAHSAFGAILQGRAVCDGYSFAAKYIFDAIGIKCGVVGGMGSGVLPGGRKEEGRHAWNVIEIDGHWYHLDVTYNDGSSVKGKRYDYFNITDAAAAADHALSYPLGICCDHEGGSYYHRAGLYISSKAEFASILSRIHITSGTRIVVQLARHLKNAEKNAALLRQMVEQKVRAQGFCGNLSYGMLPNVMQSVFEFIFM